MTPIDLPLGNYPSVTALVFEQTAVSETTGAAPCGSRRSTRSMGSRVSATSGTTSSTRRRARARSCSTAGCSSGGATTGRACRLAVETAYRGDRLVGALPLITFSRGGLRVATFIGARQSCLGDVLLAEGEGPDARRRARRPRERLRPRLRRPFRPRRRLAPRSAEWPPLDPLFQRIAAPVSTWMTGWPEPTARRRILASARITSGAGASWRELGKVELSHARTIDELMPALEQGFRVHELRWRAGRTAPVW